MPADIPISTDALDEFHGQGGSYLLDPMTGKRQRVEKATHSPGDAPEAAPVPEPEPPPEPAPEPEPDAGSVPPQE